MKVGVDARALIGNRTGIGNYIFPILDELVRLQPQSTFLLYSNDSIVFPRYDNVIFRVSRPNRKGPFWINTHLSQMLKQDCPDVFWGSTGLIPIRIPKTTATAITIHDLVYQFAPQTVPWLSRWGRRLLQPISARMADRLIVASEATGKDVQSTYSQRPHAVVTPLPSTGYNRATPAQIECSTRTLQLPPHYLLTLCTLEPRKNLAALVNAYVNRREAKIDLPPLVLAGGKGWLNAEIEAVITAAERKGFIRRLGYVDSAELPGLYAGCDTFIMPSLYEGFGMPVLEAQLCGVPVIHGPHPSMCEASENLGVISKTDFQSLCDMFDDLAEQRLPLACRHPATYTWNAEQAAAAMWQQFQLACIGRPIPGQCL
jgi:glycosyltransferase involved in cell wall biosynthesis